VKKRFQPDYRYLQQVDGGAGLRTTQTLRSSGAKYRVVKKHLAKLAAKGTVAEGALGELSGVTSLAYTSGDPVALAKAISKIRQGQSGIYLQGRRG